MKLNEFLVTQKITSDKFARLLKVSTSAVSKWRAGTRLPKPQMIKKIDKRSGGRVQLKDWY